MKCPYQPVVIHKPEYTDGYVKHYAIDITEFGDCIENECPFYYATWTHKKVEHCRRTERSEE